MAKSERCGCGEKHEEGCAGCRPDEPLPFWCESCERFVAEKRCPSCGLKTRRKKS